MTLSEQKCVPCEGGTEPLSGGESTKLLAEIPAWTLSSDEKSISRIFSFRNFAASLAFTNQVGSLAEAEGHHPDIALSWGKVTLSLSTHAIGGLSVNDFILAAKIDKI